MNNFYQLALTDGTEPPSGSLSVIINMDDWPKATLTPVPSPPADDMKSLLDAALKNEWADDDSEIPEDAAIDAEHPMTGDDPKRFRRYEEALRMVGKKRSKYGLVDLVHWLLTRAERAEDKPAPAIAPPADGLREALEVARADINDIGTAAHCISLAGPVAVPDLAAAWNEFDKLSVKATAASGRIRAALAAPVGDGWVPLHQRQPVKEDADSMNCVLYWSTLMGAITGPWNHDYEGMMSHWMRCPDAPGETVTAGSGECVWTQLTNSGCYSSPCLSKFQQWIEYNPVHPFCEKCGKRIRVVKEHPPAPVAPEVPASKCPACDGTGRDQATPFPGDPCAECRGEGQADPQPAPSEREAESFEQWWYDQGQVVSDSKVRRMAIKAFQAGAAWKAAQGDLERVVEWLRKEHGENAWMVTGWITKACAALNINLPSK